MSRVPLRGADWCAAGALVAYLALTVLPRGGPVGGLARVVDVSVDQVLWPWAWGQADPRLLLIAVMALVGICLARRPLWLSLAGSMPVLVEAWQYAVPWVGQVAAARDVVHAWLGLAVGAGVGALGLVVRALVRRMDRRGQALALLGGAAWLLLLGSVAAHPGPDGIEVAGPTLPAPQGELVGAGFHPGPEPDPLARAWLAEGTVPGAGTDYEGMARVALWDLHLLSADLDAGLLPVAGPAARWDYFWPRDGAFVAVALARTGHVSDAIRLLDLSAGLYLDPLYGLDARYLPTGERVGDSRGAQVDGCGWLLWAIHETSQVGTVSADVAGLRDRCTDQLLRATGGGRHLAAPSPDYWERATFEHLLGANAPIGLGLRSAAADYRQAGAHERARQVDAAAQSFRDVLGQDFGPDFHRGGDGGGLDAATAMLMPPFDPKPLPGVREAFAGYQAGALRPAGGLAPGTAWKQDGVSWTPEVALVAYSAAADGQDAVAHHWLGWLAEHRAPGGSLPEKVGPDGSAGGPAPLGWTAALVLLTLTELSGNA